MNRGRRFARDSAPAAAANCGAVTGRKGPVHTALCRSIGNGSGVLCQAEAPSAGDSKTVLDFGQGPRFEVETVAVSRKVGSQTLAQRPGDAFELRVQLRSTRGPLRSSSGRSQSGRPRVAEHRRDARDTGVRLSGCRPPDAYNAATGARSYPDGTAGSGRHRDLFSLACGGQRRARPFGHLAGWRWMSRGP